MKTERNQRGKDLEVFFITFDEPLKDQSWETLQRELPEARRVDSIKGFDKAHKACAEQVRGKRFISIDGDNEILPDFHNFTIPEELLKTPYILSWSAMNSINGLCYGNGGVKCWPTEIVHKMQCHENARDEKSAVDFCYQLQYYLMPETLTVSNIHHTPYQAFRSGFREGVKMALVQGEKLKNLNSSNRSEVLLSQIPKPNLERLRIWCSIGQDIKNGLWAIYGARLGLYQLYVEDMPLENIRDYDWFDSYWETEIVKTFKGSEEVCTVSGFPWSQRALLKTSQEIGEKINQKLGLEICDFNPEQSRFFKSTYKNRERKGLLK